MFSVKNGGSYNISKKHQIRCLTNLAVGNSGTSPIRNMIAAFIDETQLTFGNPSGFPYTAAEEILRSGGDADTQPCLRFYNFADSGTDCADVTIIFWYALEDQPDNEQEKKIRFVASKGKNGMFDWDEKPVEHKDNYCERFYKGHS
jgi:hypothetical protein